MCCRRISQQTTHFSILSTYFRCSTESELAFCHTQRTINYMELQVYTWHQNVSLRLTRCTNAQWLTFSENTILRKESAMVLPHFYPNFFQMLLACFTEVSCQWLILKCLKSVKRNIGTMSSWFG